MIPSLRNLFRGAEQDTRPRDPGDDFWFGHPTTTADGQVIINADTVTQIPEAYACLQVISHTIASLPLITYRRRTNGAKERFDDHPVADLLHHRASERHTAIEFRGQMTWDLLLHRNAFAEIKEGRRGPIDQLVRLDPCLTWVVDTADGYVFEVHEKDGRRRRLLPEQVFHLRLPPLMSNGILGRSLIQDGAKTFARALALQDYAARFFINDASPGGVIEVPGKFASVEQAHEFRRKWQNQFTGRNRHKVGVLDNGAKFSKVDVQNDKAQFIETAREVALQVCRLWRVPPHKIGILDRATFSNIESQSLEFVTDTLLPILVTWEQGIRRDLILNDRAFFAEHAVDGLLRGDLASRYAAYAVGRQWGWLSVDDIRQRENLNPLGGPAGQTYLQPMNMVPAGTPPAPSNALAGAGYEARIDRVAALMIEHDDPKPQGAEQP